MCVVVRLCADAGGRRYFFSSSFVLSPLFSYFLLIALGKCSRGRDARRRRAGLMDLRGEHVSESRGFRIAPRENVCGAEEELGV